MSAVRFAAVAVGAAVAGAGGVALALNTNNPVRTAVREARNPPGPPTAATLARFAGTTKYQRAASQPPGMHAIPIVGRARTLMVPQQPTASGRYLKAYATRTLCVETLRKIKEALVAAGRADEDARCVAMLWSVESGHFVNEFGWNIGNIKTRSVAGNPGLITGSPPQMWTSNPNATGVMIVVDGVRSIDAYYSFASLADYCRHQYLLFNSGHYPGVLDGYRRGGIEGLTAAARALSAGGYSPSPAAVRAAEHRWIWNLYQQRCGGPAVWETLR